MTPIRKTDSIALVGTGFASLIYKWLMRNDFSCAGQLPRDVFGLELDTDLKKTCFPKGEVLDKKNQSTPQRPQVFLKHIDVILVDVSMAAIESDEFEAKLKSQLTGNRGLRLIFFPRVDLPNRDNSTDISHFLKKINRSWGGIEQSLKIGREYTQVDFFPMHQLMFYLGLRTQVETGKNPSLELVQLAKDIFSQRFLSSDEIAETSKYSRKITRGTSEFDFIGDSHILNILEVSNAVSKEHSLLMNGSEWDAHNFSFTSSSIRLEPKYTQPLSTRTHMVLPNGGSRILLTNIATQSHCLYERLAEAMRVNRISQDDSCFFDLIKSVVKHYRAKHLKFLSEIRGGYFEVIVISDPPLQHLRINEDGRKYERTFELIDLALQLFIKDIGCSFLNLRDLIGRSGRSFDFVSNKTLSPSSDEIDWIHGNSAFYEFSWQATGRLLSQLRLKSRP